MSVDVILACRNMYSWINQWYIMWCCSFKITRKIPPKWPQQGLNHNNMLPNCTSYIGLMVAPDIPGQYCQLYYLFCCHNTYLSDFEASPTSGAPVLTGSLGVVWSEVKREICYINAKWDPVYESMDELDMESWFSNTLINAVDCS